MAPSNEAEYLVNLFKTISQITPSDGNVALERATYESVTTAASEVPDVSYEDIKISGVQRGPAKLVKPVGASKKHAILFMHGGGYSFGSLDSHRKLCAHLAHSCNTLALMVDYRLTPEHPYPAALDDCVAAYEWLIKQGFEGKNVITCGDSCGGGLTTTVSLKVLRDSLPRPGAAISLSPWYDVACKDSPSLTKAKNDALGTMEGMYKIRDRYCVGVDPSDPLISATSASTEELSKLQPHWISCAGYDMLLDDGVRMAEKLQKAGVETVLKVQPEMQHVFEFMAGRAPESDASIKEIGAWVRKTVGS
ncbi:hypothetical protein LTR78_004506 [Recurvomyces mirabilis]|uniref:Alpha/beta hydrolase fold-3 domain-containing protein n=1 Tax=Recurvomyces mirabilis TaxID=574656 RepID=A0AAE0WPD9_9PEZI|nr:hypothetical protein LTR78_004506 [Recurvomyces mirabilis]KAK5153001.1 hypothetical protein LTS14_008109 [Recurvomyces mirabilis]